MKNDLVKKILPHFIAILIFLAISVFFCRPALDGNVLNQHDVVGWKGVAQNAFDYKAVHGHFPLWNSNVFSGMPNYMIAMEGKSILPDLTKIIGLGLPQPINFFFIACVCFYILCMALRVKNIVAIFGALAYAFATYNPVILSAGHITKMFAIGFSPIILAGLILTFEKKYWLGLALTTLGAYLLISANHPQISYYVFIVAAGIGISYLFTWIKNKEWKHLGIAVTVSVVSALAGLAATSLSFLTAKEYSKATIRGGGNISIEGDSVKVKKTEGLDTSYAFQYSMKQAEPLVMLMPGAFGGSSGTPNDESSNVVKKLTARGVPENSALQLVGSLPKYWGGLESTSGAPYSGALVCLLALLGFVVIKHPARWGLLGVTVLSILMSWGKFFPGFNVFLFENLPLYNKFRAPSMAIVIAQIALPIIAVIAAQQLFFKTDSKEYIKANFKKILYTAGGLVGLLGILYMAMDFSSPIDRQLIANNWDGSGNDAVGRAIVSGLKADRSGMFGGQVLRTVAFLALLLGLIWLYIKNMLKPMAIMAIIAVVTIADLLVIDKKYLNEDNYIPKDEVHADNPIKSQIDQQLLSDTSVFRVYNSGGDRFSANDFKVSTFHKAIGGYHPAKLRLYQDIIEKYLSAGGNQQVLNMLNTKYILVQNPQNGQEMLMPNTGAYGPVWLVKNVQVVKDAAVEIQTIGTTNLKDTAIVQESFAKGLVQPQWDSTASIQLAKFDNDVMEYSFNAATPQFAVFSEVYYPYGWNAYIDGKKVDYAKTNYVLRGLAIPAGKHSIKFAFEPETYKTGVTISYIGSFLIALFFLGGLFMAWREDKKNTLKPV